MATHCSPVTQFAPLSTTGTIFVRFWPTANRYEHNWEIWSLESNSGAWINVAGIVNIYRCWGWPDFKMGTHVVEVTWPCCATSQHFRGYGYSARR